MKYERVIWNLNVTYNVYRTLDEILDSNAHCIL